MTFYKDGYMVVRGLLDTDVALSLGAHLNKEEQLGRGEFGDPQAPLSTIFHSDDLLLKTQVKLLGIIEKYTGLELLKTYNYARIYKKGSILKIHKDREACEISATIDLGGSPWDLWVLNRDENPVKIQLNPGDALIYKGRDIPHWRGKLEGEEHTQVFMHYVDKYGVYSWAEDDKIRVAPIRHDIL